MRIALKMGPAKGSWIVFAEAGGGLTHGWYVLQLLECIPGVGELPNKVVQYARFEPTDVLMGVFLGWSQHSLSRSLWTPDGSAFCFTCSCPGNKESSNESFETTS